MKQSKNRVSNADSQKLELFASIAGSLAIIEDLCVYEFLRGDEVINFSFHGDSREFFDQEDLENIQDILNELLLAGLASNEWAAIEEDSRDEGDSQLSWSFEIPLSESLKDSEYGIQHLNSIVLSSSGGSGFEDRKNSFLNYGLEKLQSLLTCQHEFADLETYDEACTKCSEKIWNPRAFLEAFQGLEAIDYGNTLVEETEVFPIDPLAGPQLVFEAFKLLEVSSKHFKFDFYSENGQIVDHYIGTYYKAGEDEWAMDSYFEGALSSKLFGFFTNNEKFNVKVSRKEDLGNGRTVDSLSFKAVEISLLGSAKSRSEYANRVSISKHISVEEFPFDDFWQLIRNFYYVDDCSHAFMESEHGGFICEECSMEIPNVETFLDYFPVNS